VVNSIAKSARMIQCHFKGHVPFTFSVNLWFCAKKSFRALRQRRRMWQRGAMRLIALFHGLLRIQLRIATARLSQIQFKYKQ
jgi:hypothetical protein